MYLPPADVPIKGKVYILPPFADFWHKIKRAMASETRQVDPCESFKQRMVNAMVVPEAACGHYPAN